jgi:hypothetical protein
MDLSLTTAKERNRRAEGHEYVPFSLWVFHPRWVSDPTELGNTCKVGAASESSTFGSCAFPETTKAHPVGFSRLPPWKALGKEPTLEQQREQDQGVYGFLRFS